MNLFWKQLIVGILVIPLFGALGLFGGVLIYPLGLILPFQNLGMGYEGWGMLGSFVGVTLGVFLAIWGIGRISKVKNKVLATALGIVPGLFLQILLYDYSMHPFLFGLILLFPLIGGLAGFYFKELKDLFK